MSSWLKLSLAWHSSAPACFIFLLYFVVFNVKEGRKFPTCKNCCKTLRKADTLINKLLHRKKTEDFPHSSPKKPSFPIFQWPSSLISCSFLTSHELYYVCCAHLILQKIFHNDHKKMVSLLQVLIKLFFFSIMNVYLCGTLCGF